MFGTMYALSEDLQKQVGVESLEEAKGSGQDYNMVAVHIQKKTDDNDHTGAVIELANFVGDKKIVKALGYVKDIAGLFGHMPTELITFREGLMTYLMIVVEKKYGREAMERLHSAF